MSILRFNQFPTNSGTLSGDDIILFMDDPSGNGITKQITLNEFITSIGTVSVTGSSIDTGDIIFSGSTISTRNADQSMTITTNGNGDIYIGADRNMIFDMNAFSAKGILLQDSQEDGYDDVETPSILKVGSIFHDTGTMVIKSDGSIVDSSGNLLQAYGGIWITNGDQTGFRIPAPTGSTNPDIENISITNNDQSWQFTPYGAIIFPNNTTVATGTFDNGTGGNNGISLNCYVGYELNWQGGHLKCTQDNGNSSANILCDSAIQFPGSGATNLQIDSSGIVYPDGTTQDSANITSNNITDFDNAISGLLPTIANSGDNRILTSTGSTVGINAESNLTFDGSNLNAPYLVSTNANGDEGGEIQLAKAPNSSISGSVVIDVYQNKLRFFEQNGDSRGYYLDLINGELSASTKLNSVSNITSGSGIVVNNISGIFNINSKLVSDPTNIPGATSITNIVQISQLDYDNLSSYDPNTIYIINT